MDKKRLVERKKISNLEGDTINMGKKDLIDLLLEKNENSSKGRLGLLKGYKNFYPKQSDYDSIGKREFLSQAKQLENEGLVEIKWYDSKSEILNLRYSLDILPQLYKKKGKAEPYLIIEEYIKQIQTLQKQIQKSWILKYLDSLLLQLGKGNIPANLKKEGFLECLKGLDTLQESTYLRIFSTKFLGDSKKFETALKESILSIVRNFCEKVDEIMSDDEILEQIFLQTYAQQLYLKGSLKIELDGRQIDTIDYKYGVALNSQTLKYAKIQEKQNIKQIITIENKANFELTEQKEGILYIFTHGFFSPKERDFLLDLKKILPDTVIYLHSSDLDYGGVRIFQYIKHQLFPEVKPLLMDVTIYNKYITMGYGTRIKQETLEKLEKIEEPLLQDLIDVMLKNKLSIEQECFLY